MSDGLSCEAGCDDFLITSSYGNPAAANEGPPTGPG